MNDEAPTVDDDRLMLGHVVPFVAWLFILFLLVPYSGKFYGVAAAGSLTINKEPGS